MASIGTKLPFYISVPFDFFFVVHVAKGLPSDYLISEYW